MGDSANVKSIEALDQFTLVLAKFRNETGQVIDAVSREINQNRQWLDDRYRYWRYQIDRREEMVRQAQRALAECLHSGNNDYRPDCSGYEERLRSAFYDLQRARDQLQYVREWKKRFEASVAAYQTQSQRLRKRLSTDVPKSENLLKRIVLKLKEYIADKLAPSSTPNAQRINNGADDDVSIRIPQGFDGIKEYRNFGEMLYNGFKKAGYNDTIAIMQGSAATNLSHDTKKPFREDSDFDIAIVSQAVFSAAEKAGMKVRGKTNQPRILLDMEINEPEIVELGLAEVTNLLHSKAKRKINYMIFKNEKDAILKAETAAIEMGISKASANIHI